MDSQANLPVKLTPELKQLFDLLLQIPPDLPRIRKALREGCFSVDDINRLAIDFVYECHWDEPPEEHEVGDYFWGEQRLRPEQSSAYLYPIMELLLDFGLDPNAAIDGEPLLRWLPFVENEYVGADTLALLFEHGADPHLKDGDGESLFLDLDFDVCFSALEQRDRRAFDALVHSWLVYIGYGALLENSSLPLDPLSADDETPFDLNDLRQHRNYTFGLSHIHSKGERWALHIFDKRTMWEAARM